MASRSEFIVRLEERFAEKRFACVGLDSDFSKLPDTVKDGRTSPEEVIFVFNRAIVDATHEYASAFKPNAAFYEAEGDQGWRALKRTAKYIKEKYPEIPVILDAKRADIGNTNEAYAHAIFDDLEMDAVTIHPYLGQDAVEPFLERKDKGIFVLVKTSNAGSGEFQDLKIEGTELYKVIAERVASNWNSRGNVGVVVGATYPEELKAVRDIVGEMPILVPGLGAQGADIEKAVRAGKAGHTFGLILNSSRGIIFASSGEDFAEAAGAAAKAFSETVARFL